MYKRLKGAMAEKGITQSKLAEQLNISLTTLNFKLNGKSEFTLSEAKELSSIFSIPIETLFYTS